MKRRLLVLFSVVAVAATCWALWVQACDKDKQTTAQATSARGAKVTAVVAGAGHADCSAAMAAECKAHGTTSAASMSGCPYHSGATAAEIAGYSSGASAGAKCQGHGASATTASNGGRECCAGKAKGATASLGHEACNAKFLGAGMMGAPDCGNHGTAAMTAEMRANCDACADMVTCSNDLSANGVQTQIVPLKNGVMFVFTSDTPAHVRAIQNALARRSDRLNALAVSGDRAHLCPECKNVRGAIASGKMSRETVNIEGGCLTLVTSTDPALISKLRAMASTSPTSGRNKI
jgi:hypothetical protein